MGSVQQSSWLVREQGQQEEKATKRKQAEAEARALRQKGVSEVKSLQKKKSTVVTGAKRGKAGSAKRKLDYILIWVTLQCTGTAFHSMVTFHTNRKTPSILIQSS